MNKSGLAEIIQERGHVAHAKSQADVVVHEVFEAVKIALREDNEVRITGFGVFTVKTRAARKARNPQTGEPVDVPEKETVSFKASPRLTDAVQFERKTEKVDKKKKVTKKKLGKKKAKKE